jgi:hypothetical protein
MPAEKRFCLECEEPILGRADKKFCSDQCRNAHHNRENRDTVNTVRNINNILRKNRRILESVNTREKAIVKRKTLGEKGYDFRYFTEAFTSRSGKSYQFCYDLGMLMLDADTVMIVRRERDE